MNILSTFVVVLMSALVLAVVAPVFFEVFLTVCDGIGFRRVRKSAVAVFLAERAGVLSDKVEMGVAFVTLGLQLVPIYLHYVEFVPFFSKTHTHHEPLAHLLFLHILPSVWINSNMLYQFYKACKTDPGSPTELSYPGGRTCVVCHKPKPPRTHHCSTCNKCVLDMDHHCPFTANCVGRDNHHHFLVFIFYSWVATLYALYLSFHPYQSCILQSVDAITEPHLHELCGEWAAAKPRLFYCSAAAFLVLTTFFGFLLFLVARDQTTLEFMGFENSKRASEKLSANYRTIGLFQNLRKKLGPVKYWTRYLLPLPGLQRAIPRQQRAETLS